MGETENLDFHEFWIFGFGDPWAPLFVDLNIMRNYFKQSEEHLGNVFQTYLFWKHGTLESGNLDFSKGGDLRFLAILKVKLFHF